ncbi:Formyltransferase/hydrolase complex Fhc subunit C [Anatilimnocola aggregata]|uniref:Formyltransferase/hydrolase complex Fhc subunit C n=1 Tax=Anatilimnocola aggregata TaxID=2528021 RepID=A0A517YIX2_9BACT|nr:formylmethanofuran dehydrogenase subunit C [Anatilimnocola aggregata]QDU30164.1 Formyltransferase/hydrolase complex Fhc subunit C [Anatilimnocola aggregata]
MPLHFEARQSSSLPIEVHGITPDLLREKSVAEIEKLEILQGNRRLPLAELFVVKGTAAEQVHRWSGTLTNVHWLGAKMKSGRIEVTGGIGRHVGSELRGGEIHIHGSVSDWLGAELHGGLIHVRGSAGDSVGSAYRGNTKGMTRGTIIVGGNAGHEPGHSLRRGLIYIAGNIGDMAGLNMLAGTILVGGKAGLRHGAGMRRGTIVFLGSQAPPLLPTFRRGCRFQPGVFPLLAAQLRQAQAPFSEESMAAAFDLYHGDLLEGGRGEILVRATNH